MHSGGCRVERCCDSVVGPFERVVGPLERLERVAGPLKYGTLRRDQPFGERNRRFKEDLGGLTPLRSVDVVVESPLSRMGVSRASPE